MSNTIGVNQFVKRQIAGSGKTYALSLSFKEICLHAQFQIAKNKYKNGYRDGVIIVEVDTDKISDFVCPYEISTNKTRLDITNIAVKENSTHMFTMNQLTLNLNGHKQSFKLCYSVRKQQ